MEDNATGDDALRVNARPGDRYDIADRRHYIGPNKWLANEALVFDFALTMAPEPPAPQRLAQAVRALLSDFDAPAASGAAVTDHARLFTSLVSEVGRLGIGLHLTDWAVHEIGPNLVRCAVQCIHKGTADDGVYVAWDLVEELMAGREPSGFGPAWNRLREGFGDSVFGGPTTYALWRSAVTHDVPVRYLWDEGLVQYGYGRRSTRGASTTFDRDSQLDSDFTTRKDDCKAFLDTFGFPTPSGVVVTSPEEAHEAAEALGWPVVVKPLSGHKGLGVTADVGDAEELEAAFAAAAQAPNEEAGYFIVETFLSGDDHRLLCVEGEMIAAVRRRAASVTGDGKRTVAELVAAENARPERGDNPTAPMGKVLTDEAMHACLGEQGLAFDEVPEPGRSVPLRKVANLSLGGVSEAVTDLVHPDNAALCRAVSQHLRLVCLGIDVLTDDISRSWREGGFGIIEINAAPGITMHLRPGSGRPVDAPSRIIETFYREGVDSRVPIVAFNRLGAVELRRHLDAVLNTDLRVNPGGCCRETVLMRRDTWPVREDYGTNVVNLLRCPTLDLLIAEVPVETFLAEGLGFDRADIVALEDPDEDEELLARFVAAEGVVLIRRGLELTISRGGRKETRWLSMEDEFHSLCAREIRRLLTRFGTGDERERSA